MASIVYCNPITDGTLRAMAKCNGKTTTRKERAYTLKAMAKDDGKTTTRKERAYTLRAMATRKERAYEALITKNADNKYQNALAQVKNLKEQWGTGISTECLIYNATGDSVNLMRTHDWNGHIGPRPYPIHIENGQWGVFLHVKTTGTATGSAAAVVYRGLSLDGKSYDWMQAWSIPYIGNNHAYTEIRNPNHFDDSVWGIIEDKLSNSGNGHGDTWNGCLSTVSIGDDTTSVFEGLLTQEGLT